MNTAQIIHHPNSEVLLMSEINNLKLQLYEVEQKLKEYKNKKQISVYDDSMYKMIAIDDIVMVSASSNYSTIHLSNGQRVLTSKTLKHWQISCNSAALVRIHKSFLVNKEMLLSIDVKSSTVFLSSGYKAKYARMSKSVLLEILC
jgi:two-component system LytT family response regulator